MLFILMTLIFLIWQVADMARLTERKNELGLGDLLQFGQYFGVEVEEVIVEDPHYLVWLRDNTHVQFDEEVLQILERL